MSLSACTITGNIAFAMSKAFTGFDDVKIATQTPGVKISPASTVANDAYVVETTLAASATTTIDLLAITNPFGESLTPTKAVGLLLVPTGTGAICKVEPGASNGLVWGLAGTGPSMSVPAGGVLLFLEPVGTTIDSTHKTLKLTNTGSVTMTLKIVVLLKV